MHWFLKFILGMKLYNFSDSSSVHDQEFFTVHTDIPSWSCPQAVSKPVWHIPLLCVQWEAPDDGQSNCSKHVEFHSKNELQKMVYLVGFVIRNIPMYLYVSLAVWFHWHKHCGRLDMTSCCKKTYCVLNCIRIDVSLVMKNQIINTLGTGKASTQRATSLECEMFFGQIRFPKSLDVPLLVLHNICDIFVLTAQWN